MPDEKIDLAAAPRGCPDQRRREVTPETLPAGRTVTLMVRGGYDLITAAYEHLFDWITTEG